MDILVNFTQQGIEELKKDVATTSDEFVQLSKTVDLAKKQLSTLDENSKEFKVLNKEIQAVEITMKDLGGEAEKSRTKMTNFKEELIKMRTQLNEMEKAGLKGTQAFKTLSAQFDRTKADAAELRDNIADIGDEINASASDTNKLDRAIRGLSLGVSTFGALEGAAVLFGGESEKVQQVLTRLNAVMLITNSLQQISTELTRKDAVTKGLASKATKLYALAVGTSTGAMKAFKIALISTGLGAFVVLLGSVVANFDRIKNSVVNTFPALTQYASKLQNLGFKITDFYNLTDEQSRRQRKAAKESEKAVLDLIRYNENEIELLEKQGKDTSKLIRQNLEFNIEIARLYRSKEELEQAEHRLKLFDTLGVEAGKQTGEAFGKNFVKELGQSIIQEIPNLLDILKESLAKAEEDLIVAIGFEANPAEIKNLRDAVLQFREDIAKINQDFEDSLKVGGVEAQLEPLQQGVQLVQEFGGEIKKTGVAIKEASIGDKVRGFLGLGKAEDYNGVVSNVLNVYSQIANIALQTSALISQAAKQRADAEISNLERARETGLISEQKYLTKVREIQNQQAKRQRRADIINAAVQIPIAVLSAFSQTNGGLIAKLAAAAIAGAFASAQVALIAKAKVPTYGEGGEVGGKLHKHGGTLIEAEKGEFIVKRKNVNKYQNMYNKNPLDLLNNGLFENYFQPKTTNVATVDNKGVIDELRFIGSYIRNGNNLTVIGNERLINAMSSKYRT